MLGIGIDMVRVSRVYRMYERHGDRFLAKVYGGDERKRIDELRSIGDESARVQALTAYLGSRWAAKEAAYKALGGLGTLPFPEMQVVYGGDDSRRPLMRLEARALCSAREQGMCLERQPLVSLSHEDDYAIATVYVQ
jgi:holo-[acyl-carrier protein] synthase